MSQQLSVETFETTNHLETFDYASGHAIQVHVDQEEGVTVKPHVMRIIRNRAALKTRPPGGVLTSGSTSSRVLTSGSTSSCLHCGDESPSSPTIQESGERSV